uniref:MATH domain-containing protein n=1 Tax=Salix viminalis TaxID=40686 RepID=A0A6N2M1M2_SALVM
MKHEKSKKQGLGVMIKEVMEEEKEAMEKVTVDTVREERHVAPANYSEKIDSFSVLSEMVDNSYESREFEASGYNWKLVLYPNGDKSRNGDGYISLYLVMADTTGSLLVGKSMPSSSCSCMINFRTNT